MELTRRDDGWWIDGAEPYYFDGDGPFTDYGPYCTKAAAADDLRGLRAFEKLIQEECPEHRFEASSGPAGRDDGDCIIEEAGQQVDEAHGQTVVSPCGV